jgi:uncharacterized protein YbjQ (UPF0145 family)
VKAKTMAVVALLLATPGFASAADKIVHFPVQNAIDAATKAGKLDGTVTFYLVGNTPKGQVTVVNDNVEVNRKTNAFGKRDQATCDWALQSVLISLQDAAKQAGANAVIDIVSDYGNDYRDSHNYECHVGFLMSGVIMKGKLAKVQ